MGQKWRPAPWQPHAASDSGCSASRFASTNDGEYQAASLAIMLVLQIPYVRTVFDVNRIAWILHRA